MQLVWLVWFGDVTGPSRTEINLEVIIEAMTLSRCNAASPVPVQRTGFRFLSSLLLAISVFLMLPLSGYAQGNGASGGEANLILPDLGIGTFFGIDGRVLLM